MPHEIDPQAWQSVANAKRYVANIRDSLDAVDPEGDPTTWIPATTNTAFARTLQVGSKLVGGRVLAPFISMVWSDSAAYIFQYTGSQFLYNSSLAGLFFPQSLVSSQRVS
jgi:zinc/manganese transport system substrate-binding protein